MQAISALTLIDRSTLTMSQIALLAPPRAGPTEGMMCNIFISIVIKVIADYGLSINFRQKKPHSSLI